MEYMIGQILKAKKDFEITKALSGEKVVIPEGTEVIIGADNLVHHISNGMIQTLSESDVVKGYDAEGIAKWIVRCLSLYMPLKEMLESCDREELELTAEIESALYEIGFFETVEMEDR